jgi:hypothetical protein
MRGWKKMILTRFMQVTTWMFPETIEEELLLALPLAPTHENCSMPAAQENGDERSPFAALKGLKPRG